MKSFAFHYTLILCLFGTINVYKIYAQAPVFTAHEWGTFTSLCGSDGKRLSGLYKEEETLPLFVHYIRSNPYDNMQLVGRFPDIQWENNDKGYAWDISLANVNVKMETPVIYFYSDQSFQGNVNVKFTKGLISQFYPYPSLYPQIQVMNYQIDFADYNTNNEITWNYTVSNPALSNSINISKNGETNTWTAPRNTDANIISTQSLYNGIESEKYLFYRGVGNFDLPVKTSFDENANLLIENTYSETIPYLFVYDKDDNGDVKVWWTGNLGMGQKQTIVPDGRVLIDKDFNFKLDEFKAELVKAGLYEKEAAAMLETWKASYFGKSGLRVFWIVPRSFSNTILPISFQPAPQKLERVLVGRSEILKPDFEIKLLELNKNDPTLAAYGDDRFIEAYKERISNLLSNSNSINDILLKADRYNKAISLFNSEPIVQKIKTFPNPATTAVTVYIENPSPAAEISLTDMSGKNILIKQEHNLSGLFYQKDIDVSNLAAGIYIIHIQTETQSITNRLLKQ